MSGEPYPGLLPDEANDRNLAPVQALHKVWDGSQGGSRNWQPVFLYREAVSGDFAARVHDTDLQAGVADLQAALVAGTGTKDLLVDGEAVGAIALPAGVQTNLCAWTDVTRYLFLGFFFYDVGGNPITAEVVMWAANPDGTGAQEAAGSSTVIVVGGSAYCQSGPVALGQWAPTYTCQAVFRGFRVAATSAAGGTCRFSLLGWRW